MKLSTVIAFSFAGVAGLLGAGCAADPASNTEAPSVATDTTDVADEGDSYAGWSQTPYLYIPMCGGQAYIMHTLTRSSGDSTRGGGGCAVVATGASCSSDSTCLSAAQASYGSAAYGYCYAGACYSRPGSQSDYCALNPNRGSGNIWKYPPGSAWTDFALGCMTKTAGPNTACGGTDASQYMRSVTQAYLDFGWCM
jgi:hypothetical protein